MSFRKIAAFVACIAVISGTMIGWHLYKKGADQRKLAEEVNSYRVRAEKGDANAESQLGHMYFHGEGVPQDYALAFSWYSKAADQGDAKAQYAVGYMYYYDKNVPQNYSQALMWWKKAANQNDRRAEYSVGGMYRYGMGVRQDYALAFSWYRKAADQGDAKAQYAVGYMYWYGLGITQDFREANRWFVKAAAQGDSDAQRALRTRISNANRAYIAMQLLAGVWFFIFSFRGGRGFHPLNPATLAGPLILLSAGLDFYWYSHVEVLRAISLNIPFYTFKGVCVGVTIATLLFTVRPLRRSALTLLRISGALLLVSDACMIARYQIKNFAHAAETFYHMNGLLIGIAVASAFFYWIANKELKDTVAVHEDGPLTSLRI